MFEPTWESVRTHRLPKWFDDAKLGIFLHWGLYSAPAWAPDTGDIQEIFRTVGPGALMRSNPYAEWYLNSMRIEGSPTWRHHRETYGATTPYDGFVEPFNAGSKTADLDALATLCQESGARYVVLTTKHHDGFCLWPSSLKHPTKGAYHAERDLVGDLSTAVTTRGMRMGLYYSGGYDWPYNDAVLKDAVDIVLATPDCPEYVAYADGHVRELVDRYAPSVLWNDICWPGGGDLAALFAYYYNAVPDGVINNRWRETDPDRSRIATEAIKIAGKAIEAGWRYIPEKRRHMTTPEPEFADFTTPEYTQYDGIVVKKWESTRGIGHSFGLKRNESGDDLLSATELIRSFCDIVSKNGNLLLGIGPDIDGSIPAQQQVPLLQLGAWLSVNGEAIYGTRTWHVASGRTSENTHVRFTRNDDAVFILLTETPGACRFHVRNIRANHVADVRLLGCDSAIAWQIDDTGRLWVDLPDKLPVSPVHALRVEPVTALQPVS